MRLRSAVLAVTSAMTMFAGSAQSVEIATHRAFYSLALEKAEQGGGISDVRGGMSFDWADSCDGWTVEQRYVMLFLRADGSEFEVTTNLVTWESKDGLDYRFNLKRETDGEETERVSGVARLDSKGGPGMAIFDEPSADRIALSAGTVFPTEHTLLLLEAAMEGRKFDRRLVFDGSRVETAAPVTSIILGQRPAKPGSKLSEPLGPHEVRVVNLAFYTAEGTQAGGEELPDFEMSLDMQDNGIVTDLTLVFDGFSVKGTLEKIEEIPAPNC